MSENEAPDMNVHSLAGTAMEMKECCQYSTKQPRMASIHLRGTRNQPARKQENNAQLSVVRFRPSEHRLKYQYSSPPFFISVSFYRQQQGPVLATSPCRMPTEPDMASQGASAYERYNFFEVELRLNNMHRKLC